MNDKPIVRVRDVMKSEVDIVEGLATVADALQQMQRVDNKCMIVNKRHPDDEYGIVLLSDIAKQVLAKDRAPDRGNVYEIMSKPVVGVDPHMDIRYCARLFARLGLSVMPVLEDEKVIGIVSYEELVLKGLGATAS